MTPRTHAAAAWTLTGVGAAAAVVLLFAGLDQASLYVVIALLVGQNLWDCVPHDRRSGRAASPPARTSITRTTRGPDDGSE